MRVRILKDFSITDKVYHTGDTVEISSDKAKDWIISGLAMEDRSLDRASEIKGVKYS